MFTPDIKSLLEGVPSPAMVLDDMLRIVDMNRLMEAMSGHVIDEVRGIHGELVLRSNVGNNRDRLFKAVLETGEPVASEGDILNCYRRKIPVHCYISPLANRKNNRRGLFVVTELVQLDEVKKDPTNKIFSLNEIIGYSPKMQQVFDKIPLISQTDASALITGETGTGKDKIAEIIHNHSPRSRFPFIKINCGALPLGLLESELFGHTKGAFTGATRNKAGMFKLADRGTLFLTEIGDMPLPLQVKLLSVLDDRQFFPIGGEQSISVDVRIIAATHRSLQEQVKKKKFREDLFYRLNVLYVHLPPLREREVDIRYLADHFLEKFTAALRSNIVGFTSEAMDSLLSYSYPGNVREMSNIVEYAVNMCKEKKVGLEHLPGYIFEPIPEAPAESHISDDENFYEQPQQDTTAQPSPSMVLSEQKQESWNDIERQMIIDTLKEYGGSRKKVASHLRWTRMKLWRKMKKYGLLA
ncbi:sigma-54 interaction domain-containing protein [Desulfogranum marinum]|jgi:transcriptional regulator with PAS, ATPase and Fis domain|uniref:sigma-54 interaction domain-containing protein n=1 Tax=Desulfogranum marinum TaxID=453220 RepID=UPI00196624F3|nr:sigma 54-interacting transcriptional regulator [Desulfogranum marinum]MBM9511050.1 sigma 54-interacting transcriptional regulator [Desulfogranum marinum]